MIQSQYQQWVVFHHSAGPGGFIWVDIGAHGSSYDVQMFNMLTDG